MDVMCDKHGTVCTKKGERRFETAIDADSRDDDWFLDNSMSMIVQ